MKTMMMKMRNESMNTVHAVHTTVAYFTRRIVLSYSEVLLQASTFDLQTQECSLSILVKTASSVGNV